MSFARLWQKLDSSAVTSTTDRTKVVSDPIETSSFSMYLELLLRRIRNCIWIPNLVCKPLCQPCPLWPELPNFLEKIDQFLPIVSSK